MNTRKEFLINQISGVKQEIKRYKEDLKDFKDSPGERVLFFSSVNAQLSVLRDRKQELRAELDALSDDGGTAPPFIANI